MVELVIGQVNMNEKNKTKKDFEKMNNEETYKLFLNIYDIERELGGNKYGHLFS